MRSSSAVRGPDGSSWRRSSSARSSSVGYKLAASVKAAEGGAIRRLLLHVARRPRAARARAARLRERNGVFVRARAPGRRAAHRGVQTHGARGAELRREQMGAWRGTIIDED